ncbi:hypothetical protein CON39_11770 [Bacillus thuringiensis]|nr:hypothetical protein CON39_11770 [Bacillus thuringiensis]
MIKISEVQIQLGLSDIRSEPVLKRVIEVESFQEYLDTVDKRSLPKECYGKYDRYWCDERQFFHIDFSCIKDGKYVEFRHFARVIEEG